MALEATGGVLDPVLQVPGTDSPKECGVYVQEGARPPHLGEPQSPERSQSMEGRQKCS